MKAFNKEIIGEAVKNSTFISPQTASLWALALDLREGSIRCLSDRSIRKAKSSS
jgi:hypothetical protein